MNAESRLLTFVAAMTRLADTQGGDEDRLIDGATPLMKDLVTHDDWLPAAMAASHPQYYQQHLLYGDPLERFSLVSFVWGAGPENTHPRPHGVGHHRHAARQRMCPALHARW